MRTLQHCAAALIEGEAAAAQVLEGEGGARTAEQMFAEIDALSETLDDERSEAVLGALYDYAESIVPDR